METTIPPATMRSLGQWLMIVSRRCEMVTGDDLDTIAMQIESSGRMTAAGMRLTLAQKWRAGCCAVRATRWILAEAALASDD